MALAAVPILMRHRQHLAAWHRVASLVLVLAFCGLIVADYLMPMGWTGFTGNTLWDWLSLLLLPTVVATASIWATDWPPRRAHVIVVVAATIGLIAIALPGYLAPWRWTGFEGNTAWDWVKLLLLPVLLPVAVIPAAARFFTRRFESVDAQPPTISTAPAAPAPPDHPQPSG